MEVQYMKDYSPALNQDMEIKVYGHGGRPVLFIPCQDGRFFDFENFNMTDHFAGWIESGQCTVFSIDTIDKETWSDANRDPRWRIERYEQWIDYITDELVPFMKSYVSERNGYYYEGGVMVFGASLGATHAVNLYYRRPDLFDRLLALSGIYNANYGFGDYMDDLVYNNSPVHYMANMPEGHPHVGMINSGKSVICVGQGAWERPDETRALDYSLKRLGINTWVDYWGFDVNHDWPWWYKQVDHFLPYLLG